ncbi:protein lifeguard 1-like [Acanthaster planci]|uniref:Protein lifeguard 1-like n=1 Tax=Acanthaster planci TaxID=133434 RepID=A0A8B7ZL15_ACAPL|nr:protein lifeguard 1-like [Acanthaster planci]XP_022106175.1 protein lifeguard 1-like [Acanthaster planci]
MSYNSMSGDEEFGGNDFEFADRDVRLGFIRKVYGILTAQLVVTVAIIIPFAIVDSVKVYVLQNSWPFWTAFAVTFVLIIALSCCADLRRSFPANFIALFLFTICEGVLLGLACSTYDTTTVLIAAGITGILVLALTIFAFQTRIDFTMMSGMLFVALITLLLFGIFAAIFHNRVLDIVYASIGAVIFGLFIVFDTQLLLGGKHKYSISQEEYIFAALNLYVDIVQLFLMILTLVNSSR